MKNYESIGEILSRKQKENVFTVEEYREQYGYTFCTLHDALMFVISKEKFVNAVKVSMNGNAVIRFHEMNKDGCRVIENYSYQNAKNHFKAYSFQIFKDHEDEIKNKATTVRYLSLWESDLDVPRFDREVFKPHSIKDSANLNKNEWNLFNGIIEPKFYEISEDFLKDRPIRHFVRYLQRMLGTKDNNRDVIHVINWLAYLVQFPQYAPETALLFKGNQGTGKTFITSCILSTLFPGHVRVDQNCEIFSKFTADSKQLKVVCIDEIDGVIAREFIHIIKAAITAKQRRIEGKGVDAYDVVNLLAFIFTSNLDFSMPIEPSDRRFNVFETTDRLQGKMKYWELLAKWVNGEGKNYLSYFLSNLDIEHFHVRKAHQNQAKSNLQQLNLSPLVNKLVESIKDWHFSFVGEFKNGESWDNEKSLVLPRDAIRQAVEKTYRGQKTPSKVFEELETIFEFPKGWRNGWRNGNGYTSYIKLPPRDVAIEKISHHLKANPSELFYGYIDEYDPSIFKNERKNDYQESIKDINFDQ
ncbi:primase-helicase family protein [Flavobacterium sp.]|jgi:hypothetical protein|uniref:primase-helicase family protein n=1 Tax=Flavobacterium sp. TaxID=239 RepID=UPI0037C19326